MTKYLVDGRGTQQAPESRYITKANKKTVFANGHPPNYKPADPQLKYVEGTGKQKNPQPTKELEGKKLY